MVNGKWGVSLKRRPQQCGPIYNYSSRKLDKANQDIPNWLSSIINNILVPEQVIINEYEVGQGISKHIDAPQFGPTIASLSMMSDAEMKFGQYNGEEK